MNNKVNNAFGTDQACCILKYDAEKGFVPDLEKSYQLEKLRHDRELAFMEKLVFSSDKSKEALTRQISDYLIDAYIQDLKVLSRGPTTEMIQDYINSDEFKENMVFFMDFAERATVESWEAFLEYLKEREQIPLQ